MKMYHHNVYLENAEKEIRENWFGEHEAEVVGVEGLQIIYWKKPGSFMYGTKFVLADNNVFVSGDIGEAVYSLTCPATLENIKGFDLNYFTGKLVAFCNNRWDFDQQFAIKELDEYFDEFEWSKTGKHNEFYKEVCSVIHESYTTEQYHAWLTSAWNNSSAISADDMEWLWDLGQKLPMRLIGYWVGLKMVAEQWLSDKVTA